MVAMEVKINAMNLQPVVKLSQVLADVLQDERIPLNIRAQYWERVDAIEKEAENMVKGVTEEQAYGNDCPNGTCDV